jgi:serine/threonine protein kinase
MPAQPAALGHYKIERTLGKGAMGVVYEGMDLRLHRRVAIKAIFRSEHADLAHDYTARFLREAQAVARLNHPNIVQVYDFGEDADVSFIVMELIQGEDLKTFFDDDRRLTLQEAVRITGELLDALDFAHGAGVIHRDIKPANIMVDRQGRTKLTDFGVARLLDVDRPGGDRTQAGTMVGTPAYMSPEQVLGQAVDHRADIFSAGVVLYQFLTGQKPFEGGAFTVAKKIVEADPKPPSSLVHSISPELDAIVAHAMAKAPDQRFARARDFAKALREAFEHSPPPSDPEATFLNPDAPPPRPKAPPPRVPDRPARSTTGDTHPKLQASEADLMFWRSVKDSSDADDLEFYIEKFPSGFYVDLARRKIAKLRRGSTVPNDEDTDIRARQMEEEFWRSVKDSNDADDIAFYVEKFPDGLYVELARRKIAKLRRGGAAEEDSGSRGRYEDLSRRQEEERVQFEAQERVRRAAEEEAQRRAAEAKRLAEEEAKRQAVAKARREAEEQARRAAEDRAKRELEERNRREAAERERREAEENARREAEENAKREAEEKARREAEEKARREAEDRARREAEEKSRRESEERAKREAEAKAAREAQEKARIAALEEARRQAEARAARDAEEKAKREAVEKARLEAEEKARRDAAERARLESEQKARREAEEKAKRETEEKAKREAEEKAKREAEEKAKREAVERAKREAEEKAKREAAERAKREAEEKAKREAAEKAKREAEEKAKRDLEEKTKRERERVAAMASIADFKAAMATPEPKARSGVLGLWALIGVLVVAAVGILYYFLQPAPKSVAPVATVQKSEARAPVPAPEKKAPAELKPSVEAKPATVASPVTPPAAPKEAAPPKPQPAAAKAERPKAEAADKAKKPEAAEKPRFETETKKAAKAPAATAVPDREAEERARVAAIEEAKREAQARSAREAQARAEEQAKGSAVAVIDFRPGSMDNADVGEAAFERGDSIRLLVDGEKVLEYRPGSAWQPVEYRLAKGSHRFLFEAKIHWGRAFLAGEECRGSFTVDKDRQVFLIRLAFSRATGGSGLISSCRLLPQ